MTRYYKDYLIRVQKIYTDYGFGYRAEFFVPKNNGLKSDVRFYETYKPGIKPGEVIEQVGKIINLGL